MLFIYRSVNILCGITEFGIRESLDFTEVRRMNGIKEASVTITGKDIMWLEYLALPGKCPFDHGGRLVR